MDTHTTSGVLHDRRVTVSLFAVFVLLALFLAVQVIGEFKGLRYIGAGVQAANTISVSGEGEVFAVPDIAQFSFSVVEEAKTVEEAQDAAAKRINKAIALVRDNGVEEKDIKTIGFNVFPRYEYNRSESLIYPPTGERELVGFEVRQSVSVKVRDTQKAGGILSALGSTGVQEISGLSFTIDDDDALRAQARDAAITDAREKAEELADALDVKLVRIVSFNESGGPSFFRATSFDAAVAENKAVGGAVPELPSGENRIVSNVHLTYEIR